MPPAALGTAIYPGHAAVEHLAHHPAATPAQNLWSDTRVDSKELALACGFLLGRHFFGLEDLHYGYWQADEPADMLHLGTAQARFSEFLLAHIPARAKSVLDVGCGSGKVAEQLIGRGHQVDCVSPGPFLTALARKRLAGAADVFECRFEEFETTRRYDVVLFCESFQYVSLNESLRRAVALLNPGGHMVIADFFRTDAKGYSPLAGGHYLRAFYEQVAAMPFTCQSDVDITREAAPTVKIVNDIAVETVRPICEMARHYLRTNRPWLSRIVHWLLRHRLAKLEKKQFAGKNTPEAFCRFKSYRVMVYQRQ
jgi:SAM-dependent methyltransferase